MFPNVQSLMKVISERKFEGDEDIPVSDVVLVHELDTLLYLVA